MIGIGARGLGKPVSGLRVVQGLVWSMSAGHRGLHVPASTAAHPWVLSSEVGKIGGPTVREAAGSRRVVEHGGRDLVLWPLREPDGPMPPIEKPTTPIRAPQATARNDSRARSSSRYIGLERRLLRSLRAAASVAAVSPSKRSASPTAKPSRLRPRPKRRNESVNPHQEWITSTAPRGCVLGTSSSTPVLPARRPIRWYRTSRTASLAWPITFFGTARTVLVASSASVQRRPPR